MTEQLLELGIPPMRYDITIPLTDGRVPVEGVKFKPDPIFSMVFNDVPRLREGNFDLCDLNLGYLLPAIEAGWEIVALPVFPKRKPFYQLVFCRADANIASPKDLEGKRIGTGRYRTAFTVWIRGVLHEKYNVDFSKTTWVVAAHEHLPIFDEQAKIELSPDPAKTPVDLLLNGDVDAIITDISDARQFAALENDSRIKRLFPSYREEDFQIYQEKGLYTPVHVMVMSKKLDQQHPELASKLYNAFEKAKEIAYDDILSDKAGFSTVYLRENLLDQMSKWGDPWKYGFSANQAMIDTFMRYNVEQGMIRSSLSYDTVFAKGTLNT